MDERITVSEEAVDSVVKQGLLTRDKYRTVKGYDKKQMERFIAIIYRNGLEDGLNAIQSRAEEEIEQADDEERVGWEAIMDEIKKVKGVDASLAERINAAITERFD